jgi:putative tryptophan/tyrosine transport system substrate-binding protein
LLRFGKGLAEVGSVKDENVTIEYRWAERRPDRLPQLADDHICRQVAVIVATAASYSAVRHHACCRYLKENPVRQGFVASLNKPGGNVAGVTIMTSVLKDRIEEPVDGLAMEVPLSRSPGHMFHVIFPNRDLAAF